MIESEKDELSNEEDNTLEKDGEKQALKQKSKNNENKTNKFNGNNNTQNTSLIIASIIIFILILIISIIYIFLSINISPLKEKIKFNLRKNLLKTKYHNIININNNNDYSVSTKEKPKIVLTYEKNVTIIDDIKNIIQNQTEEINEKNKTKEKIGIAFIYSTLYSNGIARFITVTSKNLLKTGKYNIYFFTEKPYYKEFAYEPEIKRYYAHNNYTMMRNISKYEKIDIVVLQNVLSTSVVNFHHELGQKVICTFHRVFMSLMYDNNLESYKNWEQFDSCDSFIFIASDDYYFYNHFGFKNAIFIPNLYTFEPSEIINSNLTNHNIVILGRLNDFIKGVRYAVEAMEYIVKEVPDATLSLVSSDYRVEFLKNLTRDLNLTNNIIFKPNTYNLSELFWNSSIHMYTSLSEAFPMALNEGKAHGMPLVGFKVPYSEPYKEGFIGVDIFDVKGLARETIKLLKDYDYRKKKGLEAKKSLDMFKNNETVEIWGRLCDSLLSKDRDDYRKLQNEMEKKYYDEIKAREHLESQYNILLKQKLNLTCHSFDNFTDINYLRHIKKCNISNIFNDNNNNTRRNI